MFEDILVCFPEVVESYDNSTVTFKDNKKLNYTLSLKVVDSNLIIDSVNKDFGSVFLSGILNKKNFNNVNSIFDLLTFIQDEINSITNYCVGCYSKMDFQSDTYANCGSDECVYKFEEMHIGDPVMDSFRSDT